MRDLRRSQIIRAEIFDRKIVTNFQVKSYLFVQEDKRLGLTVVLTTNELLMRIK